MSLTYYLNFTSSRKSSGNKCSENLNENPAGDYMFKVNSRNTRTRCEKCSELTIKTP